MDGYPVKLMGRLLGSADDFHNIVDGESVQHGGFSPAPGVPLPACFLFVNFETGVYICYDDEGEEGQSGDILDIVNKLPRVH